MPPFTVLSPFGALSGRPTLAFPPALVESQPDLVERQRAQYRQDLDNLRNQLSVISQQVKQ
ncbi:hypothetical protein KW505_18395, partial [Vibrio fluvialis]|nr:hypothetical protein [Vibrio fluvialis]